MTRVENVTLRRMGSGYGVYIPKEKMREARLAPGERFSLLILRRLPPKAYGAGRKLGLHLTPGELQMFCEESREEEDGG